MNSIMTDDTAIFLEPTATPHKPTDEMNTTMNNTTTLDVWWHVFDSQYLRHNLFWTVTVTLAYSTIFLVGFLGNLAVILVFALRPKLRIVTNIFIVNLAVADLIAISFCFLGNLLANIFIPWILGRFMCKAVVYLQGVSVCASAYSLAAISCHRCKAVYRPFAGTRGLSKPQALYTIALIWIFALVVVSPWSVTFDITTVSGLSFCQEMWKSEAHGKLYFLLVNFFICFVLPLALIILTNTMIWYRVGYQKLPQKVTGAVITATQHKTQNHVRRMLRVITLSFAFCWFPLYILVIRYRFGHVGQSEVKWLHVLLPFAQWLGSSNSTINPLLYAFLDRKFWEMFKSLRPFRRLDRK